MNKEIKKWIVFIYVAYFYRIRIVEMKNPTIQMLASQLLDCMCKVLFGTVLKLYFKELKTRCPSQFNAFEV